MGEEVPALGILILNRNGKEWLSPPYDSIKFDGYPEVRVYLVDNASEDGNVEMTLEEYPEVTILGMPKNLGYCMAYNLAMPHAFVDGCEWVIRANNDIQLESGCLSELSKAAQSDPQIGVLGPAFLAWDSDEPNHYMIGNHLCAIPAMRSQSRKPIDVEWVEGSFLMVSRKCVEAIGPLDPYLYFYWEEADFCRCARYRGWRVVLVPRALARHYAGGWSAEDPQNKYTANWLRSRNYYIYQLANPFQGFGRNLVDAIHLFLVNLGANNGYLSREIRVFNQVIRDIRIVHKKWLRDRMGDHPPVKVKEFESIRVEVMRGVNKKDDSCHLLV